MDFVFKAFFLQFLVLGLLLQVVRPQTGGTDCRGKDYLCLDEVRFQLCVDYGDGRPVTVNDEVQQCPSGTFCSNGGQFECDSFVPPATTAAPQVGEVTETVPTEEEPTSAPVEVEEATTLPPVEEAAPEAVPEPEEPSPEQPATTTEAEVPEVTTTEAQESSVAAETTTVAVEEEEQTVTEVATEPSVEEESTTTGVPVTEEVETEAVVTEEAAAPTTESSQPDEVPKVTEAAPEPEQETEAPAQEPEQETTVADVEVTTTAAQEQEEQTEAAVDEATETESTVATDAPVEEEEEEEVEEPVVTDAPATTENVETEAPVEPSATTTSASSVTEETSEAESQPTDLPEEAPEEVPTSSVEPEAPETTPATPEEPSTAGESGSDEGESSGSGSAQESTEQPSAESGSNEAPATTTTVAPAADAPFVCTTAGRFPHPTDCHKYYICFWLPFGLYNLEQNCLAGFAYNPTLERCTADQSVCFPGQFTCTAPGRFPDPADPTKYFWCVWNAFGGYLQYGLQCPLGQVFNQFRGRCAFVVAGRSLDAEEPLLTEEEPTGTVDEEEAVSPPVAPVESEAAAPQEALPKLKVKFECLGEGTFADPNNCARYFVCTLKKLDKFKKSKFKCLTGERFDALVGACVPDLDALCE